MSRILVTGGSGFIGTNLVERLVREGHEVANLDIAEPLDPPGRRIWTRVDILDRPALIEAFRRFGPDIVFHLAARTDLGGHRLADYPANTTGVAHVIDAARATDSLQRIVFASSRLVCRIGYQPTTPHDYQPTTPYGESKVAGERLVYAATDLRAAWTIVRPTSIWGPRFRVPYRNFFDAVRTGRYLHPRGFKVRKSFGYVGNAVLQLQRLGEQPIAAVGGRMFYLADYEPIELFAWGNTIAAAMGRPPVREVPIGILRAIARVGDGLRTAGWTNAPLTSFRLDNLTTPMVHDLEPLRAVCGPLPTTVQQGVTDTVRWMQARV